MYHASLVPLLVAFVLVADVLDLLEALLVLVRGEDLVELVLHPRTDVQRPVRVLLWGQVNNFIEKFHQEVYFWTEIC